MMVYFAEICYELTRFRSFQRRVSEDLNLTLLKDDVTTTYLLS